MKTQNLILRSQECDLTASWKRKEEVGLQRTLEKPEAGSLGRPTTLDVGGTWSPGPVSG